MAQTFAKVKSVGKQVLPRGDRLESLVLETMRIISTMVGGTLGPGGQPVLIERQEDNMPPIVTKDGVTVYSHLGFDDATAQVILEASRDAAVRTANEAGDGPQPLWSQILTPTGFIEMKDVEVGMDICGTNGSVQQVVGVFPKGEKEIVEISFGDGQTVDCCPDHLWTVITNSGETKTLTVKQIFESLNKAKEDGTELSYFTPRTKVKYSESDKVESAKEYIEHRSSITENRPFEFYTSDDEEAHEVEVACKILGKAVRCTSVVGFGSIPHTHSIVESNEHPLGNKITQIEFLGSTTEMQCIKVSNPDHLYITDDFVVTHNTTSATILAEAMVRLTHKYCKANPKASPQRVMRKLNDVFAKIIEPMVKSLATKATLGTEVGDKLLKSVACISANGDVQLADAVMQAFKIVGDDGNVTITEVSGPYAYEVERIEGYPIPGMGFEDSCGKYAMKFLNDPGNQRVFLEKPLFVIYHGKLTEIQTITNLMERIGGAWQDPDRSFRHNVILVATGFSESVLAQLAMNFAEMTTINVVPLLAPNSPMTGGQLGLLEDLSAFTGAKIFDPLNAPLESAQLEELGVFSKAFEMTRFRTTVFAEEGPSAGVDEAGNEIPGSPPNELPVLDQVVFLTRRAEQAGSELDKQFLQERIGKLTGGIARLKVIGSSSSETRERRDRVEDAVCGVRGAIKHGCLPGGCWTLMKVCSELAKSNDEVVNEVLIKALKTPLTKLLANCGFHNEEASEIIKGVTESASADAAAPKMVYDALEQKFVDAFEGGILDSLPAVLEAIRNSLSAAIILGTCGGTCVYQRDRAFDAEEAANNRAWLRSAEEGNPADNRP